MMESAQLQPDLGDFVGLDDGIDIVVAQNNRRYNVWNTFEYTEMKSEDRKDSEHGWFNSCTLTDIMFKYTS